MSTYTDLHNRVKENVTVDYNDRVTPQLVRLFNEKNEFWGTLKGHVSAENINIDGGVITGVTLKDSVLTGNITLPGGYDLGRIGNSIRQISVDLDATSARLFREEDTRLTADNALGYRIDTTNTRIDNFQADVAREFGILSVLLSTALTLQDKEISAFLYDFDVKLSANTEYLSDEIDTTNLNLGREVYDRILEDGKLCAFVCSVDLSSIARDDALSAALVDHIAKNAEEFAYADAKMLSTVEHERHYVINKDRTTNSYPYVAKDYAVNVFRASIPDARVSYTNDSGVTTEVGRILLDSDTSDKLPFTFTPYANIGDNAIVSTMVGNRPYSFTETLQIVATDANGYSLKYTIPSIADAQLSDAKLNLVPSLPEFHKVYLKGTSLMIGKVSDAKPEGTCADISSMMLFIDTSDSALQTFNKFRYIHFDKTDDKSTKLETERITYNGNNEFTLLKNIDSAKYIQLTDICADMHEQFARIYDEKSGVSGIISNDTGVTDINVFVNLPLCAIGYLNVGNGFKTVLQSTFMQDTVLSAKLYGDIASGVSADFDIVYKSEQYKYAFVRANDVGEIVEMGYVIPGVFNKVLTDSPSYDVVSVDASNITYIGSFAKVWELTKAADGFWTAEAVDGDKSINIKYNEINLFVKITDGSTGEITRRKYDVKVNEPVLANPDTCHTLRFCSGIVDLQQTRIDAELPEETYYAVIDAATSTDEYNEYVLDIDTSNNDTVKIQFPDKSTTDISREFFITIKLDSKTKKNVKAEFVYKDGTPVSIFNNKHKELYIVASSDPTDWVTYMVNEVRPNKFLITDLNDYEDHLIIEQLRVDLNNLSAKHMWLSAALSNDIDSLSANLSTDIKNLSANLSTDIDNLSTALSTDIRTLSTALSTDIDNLSVNLSTDLSVFEYDHYFKTLSADIEILHPTDPHINKVVDLLLLRDEITFDLYRLTVRNGALNLNLVEKFVIS